VLIVDDHVDSRDLMTAVLQELGVTIAEAGTGADALRRASQHPVPALVMVDLLLPDCHGTDVARALKAAGSTRDIPVITLSASVTASDKDAAAAAGCAAFIEKPFVPDEVVAIVRRLLTGV
jgi:two-component system, cell cycle response regulator DivK